MKTIKEIMTTSPKTCKEGDSLQSIAKQMASLNVGSMPVVNESNNIVGIVTDRDVCLTAGEKGKALSELTVKDAMTKSVESISEDEDAVDALKLMRTKKVGRLPVVDSDKKLKGIITLNGIVRNVVGTDDKEEVEFKGKENVINTLEAIAERNELEHAGEFGEE